MDDMQNQLNAVLGNPEMMQQIMAMAQSLQAGSQEATPEPAVPNLGGIDLEMMQKLSSIAGQSNIDNNQRNLLRALTPYVSHERITKLEKAMRASKLAGLASTFLGTSGLFSGR